VCFVLMVACLVRQYKTIILAVIPVVVRSFLLLVDFFIVYCSFFKIKKVIGNYYFMTICDSLGSIFLKKIVN